MLKILPLSFQITLIMWMALNAVIALAQESRLIINPPYNSLARTEHRGEGPVWPEQMNELQFIVDTGTMLDTSCRFRSEGQIEIAIPITRVVGEVNANGNLIQAQQLIESGLLSPTASLTIPNYDTDLPKEINEVWFNGIHLGHLMGEDGIWESNRFEIPIEHVKFPQRNLDGTPPQPAINTVIIQIDTISPQPAFCISVDWVALSFKAMSPVLIASEPTSYLTGQFTIDTIDLNGNNLVDQLVVNVETNTIKAGNYRVFVYLETPQGQSLFRTTAATLTTGIGNIPVNFEAEALRKLGEPGPYQIKSIELIYYDEQGNLINSDQLSEVGSTPAYQLEQLEKSFTLTGQTTTQGVDLDGDDRFDQLHVSVEVDIVNQGIYSWNLKLTDPTGKRIDTAIGSKFFSTPGINHLVVDFDGLAIGNNGVDGPYRLTDLMINGPSIFELVEEVGETPPLLANQFPGEMVPTKNFIVNDDSATTDLNTPLILSILNNDSDPENEMDPSSIQIISLPINGEVTVNLDGTVTYTPNLDFAGNEIFYYQVCGVSVPLQCNIAKVTISVLSHNQPPIAENKTTALSPNSVMLLIPSLFATDSDGTVVSYTIATLPSLTQGVLYLVEESFTPVLLGAVLTPEQVKHLYFRPKLEFIGNASFTYTATDNEGAESSPALVTMPIIAAVINQPPIANDDSAVTDPEIPVIIPILKDDSDPEGNLDTGSIEIVTPPTNGKVVINPDGTVNYTPNPGFTTGIDTFVYEICDLGSPIECDTATVKVIVPTIDDPPPVANDKVVPMTTNDQLVSLPPLTATDNGTVVSYTITTLPPLNQGILYLGDPTHADSKKVVMGQNLTPDQVGQLFFKPDLEFIGNASFTYIATDNVGGISNLALVTIPVTTSNKILTFLELELSPPNINLNGNLTVKGKLTSNPPQPGNLKDLLINLILTKPDGQIKLFSTQTAASGEYHFPPLSDLFNQGGNYQLKVYFDGDERLAASESIKEVTIGNGTTTLDLKLSSVSEGNLIVSGQLSIDPTQSNNLENLENLDIELIITYPDGHLFYKDSVKTMANGEYQFTQLPNFSQSGEYQLQTHFAGNENLAPIDSPEENFIANKITTTLTLKLSQRTISPNESLTAATGKLTSNSPQHGDLTDLPIKLTITPPDGQPETVPTTTLAGGVYLFTQLPILTQSGGYRLQAHFAGDEHLVASESTEILLAVGKVETAVDLELSSAALFLNGKLTVQGNLTSYPNQPNDLKDLPIELTITAPDNQPETFTATTIANGRYQFPQLSAFNQVGEYQLQTNFAGNERFVASQSTEQLLTVRELAGYALLVQGRDAQGRGQPAYSKSLSRIYQNLKDRGFEDANIIYLGYNDSHHFKIKPPDDIPTKAKIQAALQQLQTRLNNLPAPLYIVALDHGDLEGNFLIDNGDGEKIAPQELDHWLTNFENGLNAQALSQQRIIIIGSCYSGYFIPALSQPNSKRVVVTSASASEESYKGPKEPDGIRSGEYFLEALFDFLGKGYSLTTAFELATQRTEQFTRVDDNYLLNEQFQDYAVQHPLLDDNGDQQGSNILGTDGQLATTIYLGLGERLSNDIFKIESVTPTVYLNADQTSTRLWARLNQSHRVKDQQVLVSIRNPNQQLTTDGTEQREQLEIELDQTNLSAVANSNEFSMIFDSFTQAGRYDLFYSVIDSETGNRLEQHSLVYKKVADNQPPTPITLRQPENGSNQPTTLIFDWDPSSDPEGEPVTYTFLLATDPAFQPIIYQQDGLRLTMTALTGETLINDPLNQGRPGLRDDTDYVWKVQAIDKYGEVTESPVFTFHTNNTNLPPTLASLYAYNAINFTSLENAILDFLLFDENGLPIFQDQPPEIFQEQGFYNFVMPRSGHRRVTLSAEGYQDQEVIIDTSTGLAEQQVAMIPTTVSSRPGQLQFAVDQTRINKNQGKIGIIVQRVGGDDGTVSVAYDDALTGSASRDEDYSIAEGQLSWADQDSSPKKILVTLHDDKQLEGEETFQLRLREPTGGATLGKFDSITVTIIPNQPGQLQFAVGQADINENQGEITIIVQRVDGDDGAVTVAYYDALTGSASRNDDYSIPDGQLSWADQDSSPKKVVVTLHNDEQLEEEETFQLHLREPSGGATLGKPDSMTITIMDDDKIPGPTPPVPPSGVAGTLQFMQSTYSLNESIGEVNTFTVTRSDGNQGAITVQYATTDNQTAELGLDYLGGSGLLAWADGDDTPKAIELTIIDDSQAESLEKITLQLSEPTGGAQLGIDDQATLIIVDNDEPPPPPNPDMALLQFASAINWVQEQEGTIEVAVTRTESSQGEVSVEYIETVNSNATPSQDYLRPHGSLFWADGDMQPQTIKLTLLDDDRLETDKLIDLVLVKPTGPAALGNQSETLVIIQDNEQESTTTIQFTQPLERVVENQRGVLIPVIRTGHHLGTASVYYETQANSAIALQDYSPIQGRLTWTESDNDLMNLVIPILDDDQVEPEESFTLRLFNPSDNVQLGQLTQVAIEIRDDDNDPPPVVLPNLGRGMVLINEDQTMRKINLDCQIFPCSPTTAFRGGSSINGLSYHNPLPLNPYQAVTIQGEIDVEVEHVGQPADLLIVVVWQPFDLNDPALYWMRDQQGQLLNWDLNLAHLVAAEESVPLAYTQKVNFYTGTLNPGQLQLFFGYRLATGVIIFNGEQAIELTVSE
jgi:hypothetical protein